MGRRGRQGSAAHMWGIPDTVGSEGCLLGREVEGSSGSAVRRQTSPPVGLRPVRCGVRTIRPTVRAGKRLRIQAAGAGVFCPVASGFGGVVRSGFSAGLRRLLDLVARRNGQSWGGDDQAGPRPGPVGGPACAGIEVWNGQGGAILRVSGREGGSVRALCRICGASRSGGHGSWRVGLGNFPVSGL